MIGCREDTKTLISDAESRSETVRRQSVNNPERLALRVPVFCFSPIRRMLHLVGWLKNNTIAREKEGCRR